MLWGTLVACLVLSAYFSGSETALMSLNRYRLKHLVRTGHRGAKRADFLLSRPDRLISLILLASNFADIVASSIATIIALRLWGETGIAIAAGVLTLVMLIFCDVAPKTLAVLHPERVAYPTTLLLVPLQKLLTPVIWLVSILSNSVLRMLGGRINRTTTDMLTREELRTVVNEAGAMIPQRHQKMLINILDLDQATVEDIMIPRHDIAGIDLEEDKDKIHKQLSSSLHTRIPLYEGDVNNIVGVLHAKNAMQAVLRGNTTKEALRQLASEPYFVPEGTPLYTVLLNLQKEKRRIGLVVDEYGEVLGMVTLEDILEEIVGEFTTDPTATHKGIFPQEDGSYIIDGGMNIRQLNRTMQWELPIDGPKTLSGLIIEYLETIPEPGTGLRLAGYPIEILQTKDNMVKTARIYPHLRSP
ncbi:MAG: HlyC/CorC family transporter [Pseudomonadota bacterium]